MKLYTRTAFLGAYKLQLLFNLYSLCQKFIYYI